MDLIFYSYYIIKSCPIGAGPQMFYPPHLPLNGVMHEQKEERGKEVLSTTKDELVW